MQYDLENRAFRPSHAWRSRLIALKQWRRTFGIMVVAIVASIAVVLSRSHFQVRHAISGSEAIQRLVVAADDLQFRTAEGRLSGGFRYKPYRKAGREERLLASETELKIRLTLSEIDKSMKTSPTPALQHAQGAAQLLLGNDERAIDEMEGALELQTRMGNITDAIRRSNNGPLLNDLGVALHRRGRPSDYRLAIEAADRARNLWRRPESAWNYALAVAAIDLHEPAMRAWRDFRNREDSSSWWRVESERRLAQSVSRSTPVSWKEEWRVRLETAFETANHADARTAAAVFPQQTREWVEESAFADWAEAWLIRDSSAPRKLEALVQLAEDLANRTGDRLMRDHVVALQRAVRYRPRSVDQAARAHLDYQRARKFYDRSEFGKALSEAQRSMGAFKGLSLPFWNISALTVASCQFIGRDYAKSGALATSIAAAVASNNYSSTTARAYWILGLVAVEIGDPREAIAHYSSAVELFASTREVGNQASVSALLAQAQDSVGLSEESWKGRYAAFALYPYVQTPRWRHGILIEAAMAAVRTQNFSLARILLNQAIAVDLDAGDDLGMAAALRVRSMLHHLLAEESAAAADLRAARATANKLVDSAAREAFIGRLDTTFALQMLRRDPAVALQILSSAQNAIGVPVDVAELNLGISAALAVDSDIAVKQLLAAIDALEMRLAKDDGIVWQSPLVMQPLLSLYDEAITFLAHDGRVEEALLLSERARISVRHLNGDRTAITDPDWRLPLGTAAIIFYVTAEDVMSWSMGRNGIQLVLRRGAANEMRALVTELAEVLDESRGAAVAGRLSTMFIAPHWENISEAQRLVVFPDDMLWSLPFAALRGPGGRYLADDFILESAGSLHQYAACAQSAFSKPRKALLVAATGTLGPDLPALPEVRREIAVSQRTLSAAGVETAEVSRVRDLSARAVDTDMIYFAGHAVPNANDPALSHLALASGERLYARDIRRWSLPRHPVVVLSACEGAAGRGKHLDAWGSIADAFTRAGAAGVVAAITPIDDREARSFAAVFCSKLAASGPAVALNTAQRAAAAQKLRPSQWAPYVYLSGSCPLR